MGIEVRLHQTIAALAPINRVSVGTEGQSATCNIDFKASATGPQISAANAALAAFDWSAPAQALWEIRQLSKQPGRLTSVRLTADRVNSTTAYADCTGLSFELDANASYQFRFVGAYLAAVAATGIQLALNGPSQSAFATSMFVAESVTAPRYACSAAYNSGVNGTGSAGPTLLPWSIDGNVTTTAAGLLVVRFRSEVNASAVTIKQGSYGWLSGA